MFIVSLLFIKGIVARLGKTLTTVRAEFIGYFDTNIASNGGTEAICESDAGSKQLARSAVLFR